MRGVEAGEDLGAGAELGLAEPIERRLDGVEKLVHVAGIGLDKQQPGDDLAQRVALLQVGERRDPVARIVIDGELPEPQYRAVVLHDGLNRPRRVIGGDLVAADDHVEHIDRFVMGADIVEALGRFRVVVEGDARRNHVDEGGPVVLDRRLDQWHQLHLVAGEAARHERGAELQSKGDQIDRRVGVDRTAPGFRTLVGGRRKLPLGQAVDAVVLDDIDHVDGATDAMGELAEPDRGRIAVARDAEIKQLTIGEVGAGQHRRHAPVHAVETVGLAEKIGRRLRRAANAGELGDLVRLQIELEAGLDDRGADRIVATAGAQGRDRRFVIAVRVTQRVGRELRVMKRASMSYSKQLHEHALRLRDAPSATAPGTRRYWEDRAASTVHRSRSSGASKTLLRGRAPRGFWPRRTTSWNVSMNTLSNSPPRWPRPMKADNNGLNMNPTRSFPRISRRALLSTAAVLPSLPGLIAATAADAQAPAGVLPSWNDGPAKQAILDFVHATIDQASPSYVPADDRVATFDQDGTLWVEHPIYTQAMFALDRVRVLASAHPEWKNDEPFKAVL